MNPNLLGCERESLIGSFQCKHEITYQYEPVSEPTNLADAVLQIALPAGIARVGLGQALSDGEAVAVGLQRLAQLALRHQHVADIVVGGRQIALPAGIAWVGLGQALCDGEAVAVGLQCLTNRRPRSR